MDELGRPHLQFQGAWELKLVTKNCTASNPDTYVRRRLTATGFMNPTNVYGAVEEATLEYTWVDLP